MVSILFTNDIRHDFSVYKDWFYLKLALNPIISWNRIIEYVENEGQDKFLFLPEHFLTVGQQRKLVDYFLKFPAKNITIFSLSPSISHGHTDLLKEV